MTGRDEYGGEPDPEPEPEAEFEPEPIASFHIDDGQLDGLTKQACFTMGVEWGMTYERTRNGVPFKTLVHIQNCDRIKKMLVEVGWFATDVSEDDEGGWAMVECEPKGWSE